MRSQIAAALALGIFAACVFPTDSCGCSPVPPNALVIGTVRTADARPLEGAVISARGASGVGCSSSSAFRAIGFTVQSDRNGRYSFPVYDGEFGRDSACVSVTARRSASATADTITAPPVTVRFFVATAFDSNRVDLQFP